VTTPTCIIDGCDRRATERERCHSHYEYFRRRGVDKLGAIIPRGDVRARLLAKLDRSGPCWLWTGSTDGGGRYGAIGVEGRLRRAHRVAYELFVGPIPDGMDIDHTCRVTLCCNPEHLEPVTHRENVLRGEAPTARNARKTHCVRGHELAGANLQIRASDGGRLCLACRKFHNSRPRT
jgi:hypothetical protein